MTPRDLIDDLRSRINPAYAAQLGTESYERRLCAEALESQADKLEAIVGAVDRCYRMLLSEPDTKGALFKTENILREALADQKVNRRGTVGDPLLQHTKEPWSINEWPQPDSSIAIGAIGTPLIARVLLRDVSINEQKANVRRILACVNACEGIQTDLLEGFSPGFLATVPDRALQDRKQRDLLIAAIQQTLDENGHLADGDDCTLIVLKRALESIGAAQVVDCSTCRFRETKEPCRGCYEYHAWQPENASDRELLSR